jgi:hypothetical protein
MLGDVPADDPHTGIILGPAAGKMDLVGISGDETPWCVMEPAVSVTSPLGIRGIHGPNRAAGRIFLGTRVLVTTQRLVQASSAGSEDALHRLPIPML